MKVAILFFYTSEFGDKIHPFLIEEAEMLSKTVDEVHVVCLDAKYGYEQLMHIENLRIHPLQRNKRYSSVGALLKVLFRPEVRCEINKCIKDRKFTLHFIKELIRVTLPGYLMYKIADNIIDNEKQEYIIESYWYDASAYAAARLKEKYQDFKAITRAHGIEIDPVRNIYTSYELKKYIFDQLDNVCFISDYGKSIFLNTTGKSHGIIDNDKLKVFKLGVNKKAENMMNKEAQQCFHLVSCSRIESVKRVPLLVKAFAHIDTPLLWTHFGTGTEMEKVKELVNKLPANIHVELKGNCDNKYIHSYYGSVEIDLFVNVSSSEGIPVSIMEAFAYGIPCMATNVGGTNELVDDTNGMLIDPNIDEYELAEQIKSYMEISYNKTKEMRKCAYSSWLNNYNKETNSKVFQTFLFGGTETRTTRV